MCGVVKTQSPIDILITFERPHSASRKMNESSRGHVVCKQSPELIKLWRCESVRARRRSQQLEHQHKNQAAKIVLILDRPLHALSSRFVIAIE
jgi:hypothetical protein